jgi:hypothetical protein
MVGALFHTMNHAIFKGLLFLAAGSVVQSVRTRNMEEMGGLIRRMPGPPGAKCKFWRRRSLCNGFRQGCERSSPVPGMAFAFP